MGRRIAVHRPRFERLPTWMTVVAAGAALALVIALIAWGATSSVSTFYTIMTTPPAVGTSFIAPDISKAHRSLDDDSLDDDQRHATAYLAAQPATYWLTPEQDPVGQAGDTVGALAAQAREEGAAFAVAVYGLPGRDCGNHSAGGLSEAGYRTWVEEIGLALRNAQDVQKVVILEPDSLALAPECGNLDERTVQLREAVSALQAPGAWIYLDGGHSGWLDAQQMAGLISAIDVAGSVRGFATNVSNYRSVADEFAYAHEVASYLDGMHAIVDTSRSGAATAGEEWCNPPAQTVGEPSGTRGDEVVDANLWIKPPGESDGPCNGGPAAGVWWPDAAVSLTDGVR
ncbi:glycoside hydrolase family 6 protein [Microbacterium betulae]|uniref:Glucanase n=1 Tax=Microbacterium betulae TaxID=2981139 RepID=A0AA97FG49_9MICO|nr:glycoside hydrolase family 6 protein [Microbacterium sp. AB]WOF22273.1 glycoside hydrolase family 6 protein [Microbacterium sp. AB]